MIVITSSGNAVGFTQIVPNTGYRFLKNVISKDDSLLVKLGGASYENIINEKMRKSRPLTIKWLSNFNNNVIMWAYITKYCMTRTNHDLNKSLLMYNQGDGFFRRFIKLGGNPLRFAYVKHVNEIKGILCRFY